MKIILYTKWDLNELLCCCYIKKPLCDKYKSCEELELKLNKYDGLEECMRQRKYKKERGAIKQI